MHCSTLLLGSPAWPKLELVDVSFGSETGLWSSLWFQYWHLFCFLCHPFQWVVPQPAVLAQVKGNNWLPRTAFTAMVIVDRFWRDLSVFPRCVQESQSSRVVIVIWFTVSWSESPKLLLDRKACSMPELLGHTLGTRWSRWETVNEVTSCICHITNTQPAVAEEPWQYKGYLET